MKTVLLIHQDYIQHYRISVYNYLNSFLENFGYKLVVYSSGIEKNNPFKINFCFVEKVFNTSNLKSILKKFKPDASIFFINLRRKYFFPFLFLLKNHNIPLIYWGHGRDLTDLYNPLKNILYFAIQSFSDAIILYSREQKKYISSSHHNKVFIANNSLNLTIYDNLKINRKDILNKYKIHTGKNIIFIGRIQKRKRVDDLIAAFKLIKESNNGLILSGPDVDHITTNLKDSQIFKLPAMYGKSAIELLHSADIYCLPGHVGLGIVDAFYCSLPIVTEDVPHAPEIMYFHEGINGFMVPKGDIAALANKLKLLLNDDQLRWRMGKAARETYETEAHINNMALGFKKAIEYAIINRK